MKPIDWSALEREVEAWLKAHFGATNASFGWDRRIFLGDQGHYTSLRIPSRLEFALPFCIRMYLTANHLARNPDIESELNREYTLPLRQHLRALGYKFDSFLAQLDTENETMCVVRFIRIPQPRAKPLPSVRTIRDRLRVDHEVARDVRQALERAEALGSGRAVERALDDISRLIGGHGVEVINGEHHRAGYWADAVVVYVNQGEVYESTVIYDTQRDVWEVISWGDWVERAERRGERVP